MPSGVLSRCVDVGVCLSAACALRFVPVSLQKARWCPLDVGSLHVAHAPLCIRQRSRFLASLAPSALTLLRTVVRVFYLPPMTAWSPFYSRRLSVSSFVCPDSEYPSSICPPSEKNAVASSVCDGTSVQYEFVCPRRTATATECALSLSVVRL